MVGESFARFYLESGEFATGTSMPNRHLSEDQLDDVLRDLEDNTAAPPASCCE